LILRTEADCEQHSTDLIAGLHQVGERLFSIELKLIERFLSLPGEFFPSYLCIFPPLSFSLTGEECLLTGLDFESVALLLAGKGFFVLTLDF